MTEADVIQPSASIASTGLGIRYIGDYAYAFSGILGINNVETTMLEFTTGSGFIVAEFQFMYCDVGSDDFRYNISLNGTPTSRYSLNAGTLQSNTNTPLNLILPPNTLVVCSAVNRTGASAQDQAVTMTGRVYGAE